MALAPTDIKVAGHWKSVDQPSIKITGHWKPVDQIMEKVAGHWKHIGTTAHPPLFTGAIGDLTAVVGEAFTKDVSHLFSTGPVPLSYSLNNPPAGMVISNAGVISWPTPVKGDTSGVSVTATNPGGFGVSDAFGVSAVALGPELVVNYGVDANIDNYVAGREGAIAWSADNGGEIHFSSTPGVGEIQFKVSELLVAGETYILSADVVPDVPMKWQFYFAAWQQPPVAIAAGVRLTVRKTARVPPGGNQITNLYFIQTEPTVKTIVDNISARKVLP